MHFTGQEHDNETGLENFGARYDSSAMGRFMSPDPKATQEKRLLDPQDLNLYLYTVDNPLRYSDPDGENWQEAVQDLRQAVSQLTVKVDVGFGAGGKGNIKKVGVEAEAAIKTTLTVQDGKISGSITGDAGATLQVPYLLKKATGLSGEVDKVLGSYDMKTGQTGLSEPATASTTIGTKTANYVLEGPDQGSVAVGTDNKTTSTGGEEGFGLLGGGSASLSPAGVQDIENAAKALFNIPIPPQNPGSQQPLGPGQCHGSSLPNFCN
jgi:RHS repeat-associated protein